MLYDNDKMNEPEHENYNKKWEKSCFTEDELAKYEKKQQENNC